MKQQINAFVVLFLVISSTLLLACQCDSVVVSRQQGEDQSAQFGIASVTDDSSLSSSSSHKPIFRAGDFLSGVVSGVTRQIVDPTIESCLNDFGLDESFTEQLGKGLKLIESGLASNQITDIKTGLNHFANSINSIKAATSACHQTSVFTAIDGLAQFNGQDWGNVFDIIVKKCDVQIVYTNWYKFDATIMFNNAISDWNDHSFNSAGFNIGGIIELVYHQSLLKSQEH
ncbi:hypothetical protein DFA_08582 [Cavenderia fasciculata]|uniref:Lipoprotein n=1 Tax=Cavenderia fasciculata TaxID=261658 RepID=F4Q322_CACFS|nr:uncharacterized protein DFA_08582 [Cavenderia fasciculata]EGG17586.1 hypothetical protein DFA_08582 [Cavenderia fasciculata]|eukprot:XP_004356070.1 hypothetical protein DFA_08582 [Cavenderia fasciculata]